MKRKGFTLAEILGVIVIIGLLSVIIAPLVINRLRGSSDNVDSVSKDLIFAATGDYINENKVSYPDGKNYCIKVDTLIADGRLSDKTKNVVTGESLNNYYVSANIYGVGNIDYNLYKTKEECENVKALPVITFTVSGGWNNSKDVIINFPVVGNETFPDSASDWKYSTDNTNWTNLNSVSAYNGTGNKVNVTVNGTVVYASMKYGDKVIKNQIRVDMIDTSSSNIEIESFPTDNNVNVAANCSDGNNAIITISGNVNKLDKYVVTESFTKPSSGWIDIRDVNGNKVDKATVKYKVDYESSLESKTYYVHVLDSAGNYTNDQFGISIYHTVTFNTNGGSSISNQTVKNGDTYDLDEPSKTGYTFAGWFKDSELTKEVKNGDLICLGSNITLYAKWTANTYKVVFNGNGNTGGSTTDKTCTYDKECTLTSNGFTKNGYTFAGWATTETGEVAYANSAKVNNLATSGNVDLYAKWTLVVTKPTCTLALSGTKGSLTDNKQWYKGEVTVTMTTSTGQAAPTSYGLDTSSGSTNKSKSKTQKDDTKGTTYYGYVSNSAGSGSCSIVVYKDTVAPEFSSLTSDYSDWTNKTVKLTAKGSDTTSGINQWQYKYSPQISSQPHIQDIGWRDESIYKPLGTTGLALRLEGYKLKITNSSVSGGIKYNSLIEGSSSWQGEKKDGAVSGTEGQAKKLYKVKIALTGDIANYYDVKYRTHLENSGWGEYKTNGSETPNSGTNRIEALEVSLASKSGTSIPWANSGISTATYSVTFSMDQNANKYFRLCDKAGNCSGSKSIAVKKDSIKPLLMVSDVKYNGNSIGSTTPSGVSKNTCFHANNLNKASCELDINVGNSTYNAPETCIDNLSGCQESEHKYINDGNGCYVGSWTKYSSMPCWNAGGGTYRKLYSRVSDNAGNSSGEVYMYVH